ncbi:MAG: hypothetical protein P0S96_06480 [Simkaniaceae bacterium]|nr:hypothetical protein [Candidatus Sacchlamyda saccharinae]
MFLWSRKDLLPRVRDTLIAQRVIDLTRSPNPVTHGYSLFDQMQNRNLPTLKGFVLSAAAAGIATMFSSFLGILWLGYWGLKIASIRRNTSETLLKDRMLIDATKDIEAAEVLLNAMEHVKAENSSAFTRFFHERILGDASPSKRIGLLKQYKIQYVEPSWTKKPIIPKGVSPAAISRGVLAF